MAVIATRPALGARRPAREAGRFLLALAYAAFVLLPVVYMVLVSLQDAVTAGDVVVPRRLHWQTFLEMWRTVDLGVYLRNSLLIAALTGVFASVLALGAGYVVARFRFRFRNAFRVSLLATHTVPGVLLLLPLFVIYVIVQHALSIRIVGSYFGVVLTYMTFALPFSIWMLSVYIASLPVEIEEQALVDGANRFEVLRYVTFPLAVPGMVVTFVFSFLLAWNDVLFASVLTSPATRTVAVGLQSYLAENQLPLWNQLMAASIVSAVPAIVLFMIVQRWIVAGLASGSLKG
ncbi:MAG TPA: carbohydrate ABC transporter permease [Terriglobales bacterium]|nr:carbohydrate ABC transporter permease [Terriglobales bacterium]